MNMTRENYPKPGAYVQLWKRVKAAYHESPNTEAPWLDGWTKPVCEIWQEFVTAMHSRINKRGGLGKRGRKDSQDYVTRLRRDQRAIQAKVQNRVRLYQFQTVEAEKRFGHLLDSPFEV